MSTLRLYVGTYTQKMGHVPGQPAEGIYLYHFEAESGALARVGVTPGVDNPSYLAFHPTRRFLYTSNETPRNDGVSAFAINAADGRLSPLNRQPAHGSAACFVSVDQSGRYLLCANYGGGNVVMYPIQEDGSLGEVCANIPHTGYGPDPARQAMSHAHSIFLSPDNRFALSCDLGLDKVIVYRLDLEGGAEHGGKLIPHSTALLPEGAGPRHLDFHPNGRFVYVIGELGGSLTAFAWDAAAGQLSALETLSTLPEGYSGRQACADVHIHPSGRFLYGSNRFQDSIVIYRIDPESGRLSLVGHEPVRGKTPRNFAIDPSGQFLLAANQDSGNIVTFRIDPQTGGLSYLGSVECAAPVCLKF